MWKILYTVGIENGEISSGPYYVYSADIEKGAQHPTILLIIIVHMMKIILRRIKDGDAHRNPLRSQTAERRHHRKNYRHGYGDPCLAGKKPAHNFTLQRKIQRKKYITIAG